MASELIDNAFDVLDELPWRWPARRCRICLHKDTLSAGPPAPACAGGPFSLLSKASTVEFGFGFHYPAVHARSGLGLVTAHAAKPRQLFGETLQGLVTRIQRAADADCL